MLGESGLNGTVGALPELRVVLAGPRGFCAGVDRAIRVVEEAIRRYGKPVYVRHEIVHNRTVWKSWRRRAPCSSRSWTRFRPMRRWCSARTACRNPCRPRQSGAT